MSPILRDNQLSIFQFTSFADWTRNIGFEIDICRFNFTKWLNYIDNMDDALEWINWNFELVELFFELYVKDSQDV